MSKPIEIGLPLRNFVRGFLRDHLGMSKIAAHMMADLFMERWVNRKHTQTDVRYADQDDLHTLQKTWDRLAREAVEARLGQPALTKDELREGIERMRQRKLQREAIDRLDPAPRAVGYGL